MSMPSPAPPRGPRASRTVKLALMGVAGAALLYSCGPGVGAGLGALPYLWFMPNPFYRAPATACPPGTPNCEQQTATSSGGGGSSGSSTSRGSSASRSSTTSDTSHSSPSGATTSQRGGFGSTSSSGSSHGSS
jgi:Protein of unknown function (DUF1190)